MGTMVRDLEGVEYAVSGGVAPHKPSSLGFVYLTRPGTSTPHQVRAPVYGFEWILHGLDRRSKK
jgi:hypothetical protein